jgi:hypothetical protein
MTSRCPSCQDDVEFAIRHHGVSSDGKLQRATLEAVHSGEPCDAWKASEVDLIVVARG